MRLYINKLQPALFQRKNYSTIFHNHRQLGCIFHNIAKSKSKRGKKKKKAFNKTFPG